MNQQPRTDSAIAGYARHFASRFVLIATIAAMAVPAAAQTANTVTFMFGDGEGITGELLELNDQTARLQTSIGAITVPLEGASCIGLACPDAIRFVPALPPLVLTSIDGSVELTGNLLDIVDGQYILATDIGEMKIDVAKVRCSGEGCPADVNQPDIGGQVVLTNGSTTLEGNLVGFEETAYIIDVEKMGRIRVSSDLFECTGASCP